MDLKKPHQQYNIELFTHITKAIVTILGGQVHLDVDPVRTITCARPSPPVTT